MSLLLKSSGEGPSAALRALGAFEAIKGVLVLAATAGLVSLRHTDLHEVTEAFLLHHGLDPERHFTRLFVETVARATHQDIRQVVAFGFIYAVVRLAEGYGLWNGRHWAEWFAALSAGLYLPFEITHFFHKPTAFNLAIILVNVALVLYLGKLLAQQRTTRSVRENASPRPAGSVAIRDSKKAPHPRGPF